MKPLLKNIRQSLLELADESTRQSSARFFKETEQQTIKFLGVKSALVTKIAKEYFASVKEKSKEDVFSICETLWKSDFLEEHSIACEWCYRFHRQFKAKDILLFESWIERFAHDWASCDSFCGHSVGTLLEMYPKQISKLKSWAKSSNLWMRRAAAVSLIVPARKGIFHKEIFEIATVLLHDTEDLVQKGYGWMLKAAADSDQDAVFQFVMKHKETMPRTALRYAIEKMPQSLKSQAMEKAISSSKTPPKQKKQAGKVPHLPKRYTWVDAYCRKKQGCTSDFKQEWDATRYMLEGKFFAMLGQGPDKKSILTLKLEPKYGQLLRMNHKEVTPGYYMNKEHWNSVSLESDFSDNLLKELIDESYKILLSSFSKKVQQQIAEGKKS